MAIASSTVVLPKVPGSLGTDWIMINVKLFKPEGIVLLTT